METLLRELAEDIQTIEKYNQSMDSASWGYEEGILITGNEAKAILEHTTQLQADKAELLEALQALYDLQYIKLLDGETPYYFEAYLKVWDKTISLIKKHKQ